jgi:Spy/CpxP family protein refolding chaperone
MADAPLPTDSASKALAEAFKKNFGGELSDPIPPEALPSPAQRAGITGPAAPTGPTGATAAGPTAPTGPTGATAAGPTGATAAGPTGETGATAAGPTGATAAGPTGETGATAAGPTGATGATREQLDEVEKRMGLKEGTAFRIVRSDNDRLEGENKQLQTSLAERDTLIAQLKANQADSEEIKKLREKVAAQDAELAVIRYEATPEFQTVQNDFSKTESGLFAIAKKYNIPARDLAAALSEKGEETRRDQLAEMSKDFKPFDLVAFDRLVQEYDIKGSALATARAQAADRLRTRQAAEAEAARTQMEKLTHNWKTALDLSAGQLATEIPLTKPTGDEKWDTDVKNGMNRVKSLNIAQMKDEDIALRFYKSEMLPLALRLVKSLTTDVLSLQERVTKLQGGTPPAGGGAPPPPTPPATGPKPDASFLKVLQELLPGTGLPK